MTNCPLGIHEPLQAKPAWFSSGFQCLQWEAMVIYVVCLGNNGKYDGEKPGCVMNGDERLVGVSEEGN